jgi:hypothetical protein
MWAFEQRLSVEDGRVQQSTTAEAVAPAPLAATVGCRSKFEANQICFSLLLADPWDDR